MRYTGFKNVSNTINCRSISKRINRIIKPLVIARRALIIVEKQIPLRPLNPVGVLLRSPDKPRRSLNEPLRSLIQLILTFSVLYF